MIIDQATIITGSFNFTKAAEEKNAEILIAIREMATKERCSVSSVAERLLTVGLTCPHCDKPHTPDTKKGGTYHRLIRIDVVMR